ncbi:MAG: hypothetical protein GEU73_16450 [Chloroflexi bacterium]|nr:hypothetical protein [Chloroflexota bacterium]
MSRSGVLRNRVLSGRSGAEHRSPDGRTQRARSRGMNAARGRKSVRILPFVLIIVASACAPTSSPPSTGTTAGGEANRREQSLVAAVRVEPSRVAAKATTSQFVNIKTSVALFNATLDLIDDRGAPQPYLAEALPQLNTDSWQVFPDGRMETRYRLKPDLVWHDGTPLTANDFVFSWQVFATPEIGTATSPPIGIIEEVLAPDDRTLVIQWRQLYSWAGTLQAGNIPELPPLPPHILGEPYQRADWEGIINHAYWSTEFIGLGPYRLERWEPGSFFEGVAFDRYVFGRPKIDRVKVLFMSDANAALSSLLAGEIQLATDNALGIQQGVAAKKQAPNANLLLTTDLWRAIYPQLRPELATPQAILDLRVRKALAHAIDKQPLNDTLYEGLGVMADSVLPPGLDYSSAIEQAVVKYPYSARAAEQLLNEAGYTKRADGLFAGPDGERFTPELKTNASVQYEQERSIVASSWRQLGIDVQETVLPAALAQSGEARATFPGFYAFSTSLGDRALRNFASAEIPSTENRWTGSNRGGWSNAEYDGLVSRYQVTLDRNERVRQMAEMARLLSDQLPAYSLYYDLGTIVHVTQLRGLGPVVADATGLIAWNVHLWELS